MSRNILTNSLILSAGLLIGRFSGYIRELIIASKFEVSVISDNIILMLAVPDLLNNLLSGSAVSGILIPLLSENKNIAKLLTEFTKKLFIVFLLIYIIIISLLFALHDFYLFTLLSLSLLAIFPNTLTFVATSYLQFEKRFQAQALNTLIFNAVIIIFLLFGFKGYLFASSIIIASITRMLWIIYDLRFTRVGIKVFFENCTNKLIEYKLLFFILFSNGLIFLNPVIDKLFASFMQSGSVSILSYAEKLYLLPVSVFLTTYAAAMLPDLSKMVVNKEVVKVNRMMAIAIGVNIGISVVVALCIYFFSFKLAEIFYGITGMKQHNILQVSEVLKLYTLSIVFAGTNSILLNLFFSLKWYKKLLYYSFFILFIKFIFNTLILYLGLRIELIALSSSILITLSVCILFFTYAFSSRRQF